jgi:TP901 family phage tail tape measure protein
LAEHVVSVTLRAQVANYLRGMQQVHAATQQANTEAQNLQAQGEGFEKVGKGLLTIGGAAAAGVAIAVKAFADFDAQMSQVQSLSGATASEMDRLRNAALTMGQSIGFSATEVAEAETELVKAGVSVKDIMGGGLKGALNLAAAGQIDVARATEIAASALTQFGLKGKDVPHVADLLAAGADKALGGVEQLGQALQQSGLVANQFGLSIDETVGTLAEFAQNGLMGSDAGTSLKQMFLMLANPSKQAADAMKQYNIQAYDAQGNFVGITSLAGQLKAGFTGVADSQRDAALATIFGSDAIRAANILYTDGASKNRDWINSVNEAGFAATQAAGKTDNLNGDVKKLGAALESGLIKSGSASNSVLRELVQSATGLASAFTNAPGWIQGTALSLTAVVAATALAGGGFLTMVPKVQAARLAMQQMNLTVGRVAKGFGKGAGVAVGIAAVISGFSGLGKEANLTEGEIARLNAALTASNKSALNQQFTGGGGAFDFIQKKASTTKQALDSISGSANERNVSFGKFVDGMTFGLTHMSDTATRFEAQFKQMGSTLATTAETDVASAAKGFNQIVKQMGGGSDTARDLLNKMKPYKDELMALAAAQGHTLSEQELLNAAQGRGKVAAELAAQSTAEQNQQLADLSGVASQANQQISELADQIRGFGSTQLSVEQTESDLQQAIDDATQALKDNGVVLSEHGDAIDLDSEKGRANAAALRQIAQDGVAATAAIVENGGSASDAAAKMQSVRDAYIQTAEGFGLTKEQATAAADALKLIPENVKTTFSAEQFDDGKKKIDDTKMAIDRVPSKKETKLKADLSDAKSKLDTLQGDLKGVPAYKQTYLQAEIAEAKARVQDLQRQIAAIPASKTTTLTTVTRQITEIATQAAAAATKKASGGYVAGPGTATSDSIPAMLSDGEYVIRAASVQKYGRHTFDRMNAGHYATGGHVTRNRQADRVEFDYNRLSGNYSGTQGVSALYSLSSDTEHTAAFRWTTGTAALRFQKSMGRLADRSDAASDKLQDLRSSASSLRTSVANAVGQFNVGDFSSAGSLKSGLSRQAGSVKEFAGLLSTLAKKGIRGDLLAEIASLGTAEGLPLARSLAKATAADIKSINSSYASIQKTADKAGQQVADVNHKAQIRAADRNAKSLERQIAKQSRAIQRIIAKAFGVRGFSEGGFTGMYGTDQVAGMVHGQEFVVNAAATARNRAALEAMNNGRYVHYMQPNPVQVTQQPIDQRQFHQHNDVKPMQHADPQVVLTVLGRELGRDFAGMV